MLAVNGVGKPCAGEPHARIDGRELETEHATDHGEGEELPDGKPTGHTAPAPPVGRSHRASSRPSNLIRRWRSSGSEQLRRAHWRGWDWSGSGAEPSRSSTLRWPVHPA